MLDKTIFGIAFIFHFIFVFIPSFVLAGLYLIISKLTKKHKLTSKYYYNLAVSFDQVGNTSTGGDYDETLSSRSAKLRKKRRWACILCVVLDAVDKNHCDNAIEADEGKNRVVE